MDRQSSTRQRADQVLSRRNIFKGAVGVAAVGAGGAVLTAATASQASAAVQATTVESGALAPAVVGLTDAATIAVDASLGNDFRVTIAGNRTMANPANPSDGQKITFQVTQGSGGSFTLTWGSSYEFSTGLPQPTLSTAAGQTDLLCFIYNGTKAKWLLAAFVAGFSTPVVTGPPPGTYRLFPSTNGPASPVSYSGPFVCGVVVGVTTGGCWLDGYWWWVCPTGQSTSPQKFALWSLYNSNSGSLVPNSTVTSGALTAGQWNYVPLTVPLLLPLALGATYVATTGFTGSFPDTSSQFGSGDPYSAGIVSGPLTAYSDASGSNPSPFKTAQAVFSVASSDPTTFAPVYGSSSSNFWMDLQVDTVPPTGTSYRLWPSYPTLPGHIDSDTAGYTLATEFQLSTVLHAGQHLVLLRIRRERAAHSLRDLERQLAERGRGHRQHVAVLVGGGRVRLGGVLVQRRHPPRRGLQGGGVLRWRDGVVSGHHELLGRRGHRRQRYHERAGHRAGNVRRHEPRAGHL